MSLAIAFLLGGLLIAGGGFLVHRKFRDTSPQIGSKGVRGLLAYAGLVLLLFGLSLAGVGFKILSRR